MLGAFQCQNAALAAVCLKFMSQNYGLNFKKCLLGMEKALWPGRMQFLPDGVIVDGAHNAAAVKQVLLTLEKIRPAGKWHFILGAFGDKNWPEMMDLLAVKSESLTVVPVTSVRSSSPEDLLKYGRSKLKGLSLKSSCSLKEAVQEIKAPSETVILGSLHLAGEVLKEYFGNEPVTM